MIYCENMWIYMYSEKVIHTIYMWYNIRRTFTIVYQSQLFILIWKLIYTYIFLYTPLYFSHTFENYVYMYFLIFFSDLNKISGTWICFEDLCIFAYFMFSFSIYCKRFHYTQIKHAESNSARINDDLTRSFIFALNRALALVQFRTWHVTEICKYMYNNTGDYE